MYREENDEVNIEEEIIFCARYSRRERVVSSRFEEDVARNFAEVKLLGSFAESEAPETRFERKTAAAAVI